MCFVFTVVDMKGWTWPCWHLAGGSAQNRNWTTIVAQHRTRLKVQPGPIIFWSCANTRLSSGLHKVWWTQYSGSVPLPADPLGVSVPTHHEEIRYQDDSPELQYCCAEVELIPPLDRETGPLEDEAEAKAASASAGPHSVGSDKVDGRGRSQRCPQNPVVRLSRLRSHRAQMSLWHRGQKWSVCWLPQREKYVQVNAHGSEKARLRTVSAIWVLRDITSPEQAVDIRSTWYRSSLTAW